MKILVIVPAFNESQTISKVIKDIKKVLSQADVLVVDDGSNDSTSNIAKRTGIIVLRHILNRGLGGAIGTGLLYAKKNNYDLAVTIDADGQHDPHDIIKVIDKLTNNQADVVIGSRMLKRSNSIPFDRVVINTLANWITFLALGIKTTDSQSGFRGFNRKAIKSINLKTDRMEVSTEVFAEVKRLQLHLTEIPIKVIYSAYSRAKGQSNSNAINVGYKLMLRLFR